MMTMLTIEVQHDKTIGGFHLSQCFQFVSIYSRISMPFFFFRYLDYVFDKYRIDYVIHGDDPCIVDGKDVYAAAKEAGKFRSIPRTEGVSTTELVGRMLLMTKEHHFHQNDHNHTNHHQGHAMHISPHQEQPLSTSATNQSGSSSSGVSSSHPFLLGQQSKFLTTTYMLRLFSAGIKPPTKDQKVVYMDGAWDLFHPGHVAILKAAREVRGCCGNNY